MSPGGQRRLSPPLAIVLCCALQCEAAPQQVEPPVASPPAGSLRGMWVNGTRAWLGVPYAAPPVGALRFERPAPPPRWGGVRDAAAWGPSCMYKEWMDPDSPQSEDCLYLNVVAPAAAPPAGELRQVLVWIHGGCYIGGATRNYHIMNMSRALDAIVVSMDYRLNGLAYMLVPEMLANGASNLGLLDQQLALKWVNQNIRSFGGDPSSVMIFGESAGGGSVASQLIMKDSWSYYRNAVMESPDSLDANGLCTFRTKEVALEHGLALAQRVGCTGTSPLACLKRANASALVDGQMTPVVDGTLFPDYPLSLIRQGSFNKRARLIIGQNSMEEAGDFTHSRFGPPPETTGRDIDDAEYHGAMACLAEGVPAWFAGCNQSDAPSRWVNASAIESWYAAERARRGNWHAVCRAQTHWGYCCPQHRIANAFAAHADVVVYYYWFRHHTAAGKWAFLNATGVPHGSEQPYVLHDNSVLQWYPTFTTAEWALSQLMGEVWLAHGTHGDPNRAGGLGVTWPRYTGDSGAGGVLAFDVGAVEVVPYPERDFCTHWPSGLGTSSPSP